MHRIYKRPILIYILVVHTWYLYNFGNIIIIFVHSELDLKSLVEVEVEGLNLVSWGFRRLKMTSVCDAGP